MEVTEYKCKNMKNKIIKQIFLFVLSVCLFSCGGRPTSNTNNEKYGSIFFVFDLENSIRSQGADAVLFNSLIDSVRFIPLETKKESVFMPWIPRLGIISPYMFISGGISMNTVLQFDFEGKYIGQIVHRGQGPSELPNIFAWYTHGSLQQLNAAGGSKMVVKLFKNNKNNGC